MTMDTELKRDDPSGGAPIQEEVKQDAEYKVGPGRPPKAHQFKKGQSGNPKGAKRKTPSLAPDVKKMLEQALDRKVTVTHGQNKLTLTLFEAGIEQLVRHYAKGDHRARKDVFELMKQIELDSKEVHKKENTTPNVSEGKPEGEDTELTKEEIAELSDEELAILGSAERLKYKLRVEKVIAQATLEKAEGGNTEKRV
jgi:hypothetical protein